MEKAYLTIVVEGIRTDELIRELNFAKLGNGGEVKVLEQGNIVIADENVDEKALPNAFWMHQPEVYAEGPLYLVDDVGDKNGRMVSTQELDVMRQFGVLTNFKVIHPDAGQYLSPLGAIHDEAAEVDASGYGIKLLADGFCASYENGDDGSEERWLRVIMPAWFNPSL